jgi:hypothetical protein
MLTLLNRQVLGVGGGLGDGGLVGLLRLGPHHRFSLLGPLGLGRPRAVVQLQVLDEAGEFVVKEVLFVRGAGDVLRDAGVTSR